MPAKEKVKNYRSKLVGKLKEKQVCVLSDSEIERAFNGCVASSRCTRAAKTLRDIGAITLKEIIV